MGTKIKYDNDKSYVAIAINAFEELFSELNALNKEDGRSPSVEIIVRGSRTVKFEVPSENFDEIIEILRISLQTD